MKSICIKTNDSEKLNYLLDLIDDIKQEGIFFSCNTFKHYKNVIIHYVGTDTENFLAKISEVLSCLVIDLYEKNLLKRQIFSNYFYFDAQEIETVFDICLENLSECNINYFKDRYALIYESFSCYLFENNALVLDGFINFRLQTYINFLNQVIDDSVNQFIIEREYWEFISLLKVYINSETSSAECVHLIYDDKHSVLLDKDKNVIDTKTDSFNAIYLSDITFSSNDYALNTLLNILPKKIYVHLTNEHIDEFINTLLLIFEKRVEICSSYDAFELGRQ